MNGNQAFYPPQQPHHEMLFLPLWFAASTHKQDGRNEDNNEEERTYYNL